MESVVVLRSYASVIGLCLIWENTIISLGAQIINQETLSNFYVCAGENSRPAFKEIY